MKTTEEKDAIFDLAKWVQEGEPSTRKEVQALLARDGDQFSEYEMKHLTDVKLSKIECDNNIIVQQVSLRELRRTAEELAGLNPIPPEQLLAHRVAVCQHAVTHAEYRLADQMFSGESVQLAASSTWRSGSTWLTAGSSRRPTYWRRCGSWAWLGLRFR